jgi:hypothetical protein
MKDMGCAQTTQKPKGGVHIVSALSMKREA